MITSARFSHFLRSLPDFSTSSLTGRLLFDEGRGDQITKLIFKKQRYRMAATISKEKKIRRRKNEEIIVWNNASDAACGCSCFNEG